MRHASSVLAAAVVVATTALAHAQGAGPPADKHEMMQSCPGLVAMRPPFLQNAALRLAALERDQARLTYICHSTFLVESPQVVRIATDYNDYVRPSLVPDVATMNESPLTQYPTRPAWSNKTMLYAA